MPDDSTFGWRQITLDDGDGIRRYMDAMKSVRPYYADKGMKDLGAFLERKTDVEAWIWEDEGWSIGIVFCFKDALDGHGAHFVANSWIEGDVDWKSALLKQIEKGKDYAARYNVQKFFCRQPKDLTGINAILLGKKQFAILKEHFKDAYVVREDEGESFYCIEI